MYDYGEGKETRCTAVLDTDFFLALCFLWEGINDPSGLNCRLTRSNDALGPDLIGRNEAYTRALLVTRAEGGHADRRRLDKRISLQLFFS